MKRKRILLAAVALCLVVALSACAAIDKVRSGEAQEMMKENFDTVADEVKTKAESLGEAAAGAISDAAKDILPADMKGYTRGAASVDPAGVSELEIEWVSGACTVEYADGGAIEFTETASASIGEDQQLYYKVEDGKLHIAFCAKNILNVPEKTLTVKLPASMTLEELEVETVSASAHIGAVTADKLDVSSVSGNLEIAGATARKLKTETVSGAARIVFAGAPAEIELQTVSGDFVLEPPEDLPGYTLRFESVSGGLESSRAATTSSRKQIYGDGSTEIDFESVSGGLTIR